MKGEKYGKYIWGADRPCGRRNGKFFRETAERSAGISERMARQPDNRIKMTEVKILDKKGEKGHGQTDGSYITLEADQLSRKDEDYHREVSEELARQIGRLLEGKITKLQLPRSGRRSGQQLSDAGFPGAKSAS